jgi:steroid 5-alpha reductase family enzyme
MQLDIRVPVGMLFMLIGALLLLQGLLAAVPVQRTAAPVNIDVAWGLVMVIFGGAMLLLARRRRRS